MIYVHGKLVRMWRGATARAETPLAAGVIKAAPSGHCVDPCSRENGPRDEHSDVCPRPWHILPLMCSCVSTHVRLNSSPNTRTDDQKFTSLRRATLRV
jgi:hypothetical protein